jgi:hypothetical protein
MTKETETYNGYTNYETWLVSLWLDNDERTNGYLMDLAADESKTPYEKERELQTEIEDMAPDLGVSMFADMLMAAIQVVNWREIITSHQELTSDTG